MRPVLVVSGHERLNAEGPNFLTQGADLKMRKKKRHQRKGKQLKLFEQQVVSFRPKQTGDGGTDERRQGESNFFSLLARNRALTGTLLDEIMSPTNLNRGYEAVRQNGGSSGVDQMTVWDLREWLKNHGKDLIGQVLEEAVRSPVSIWGKYIQTQRREAPIRDTHGNRPPHPAGHTSTSPTPVRTFV